MTTEELSTDLVGPRSAIATGTYIDMARAATVVNNDEYVIACEFEKTLRALDKTIVEHHSTRKRLADQLHKRIVAEEKEDRQPIQEALAIIRPKRIGYEEEQERLRKEEEARQREAQRKLDEDEKLKAAVDAEAQGASNEFVERLLDRAPISPPIAVPNSLPSSGIPKREHWTWEGVDLKALVQAACKDDRYLPLLDFNRQPINAQVRSLKSMCSIPGIEIRSERR